MLRRCSLRCTPFSLAGKSCLVTGGANGIGRATAMAFAQSGAKVVLSDSVNGQAVADEINAKVQGKPATFFTCDVTKRDEVKALVAETMRLHKRLDCAFNNAGVEGKFGVLTEDITKADWDHVMNVNVNGVLACMQEELHVMLPQGSGVIVNMASVAGIVGFPGGTTYDASKHAVIAMTQCAALEYVTRGIRINSVLPGPIVTPMLNRIMSNIPEMKKIVDNSVPAKRSGEASEIAWPVVFLCSDAASYLCGPSLVVDGGMTIT
jgi:NAD(P)-dependent dehydrogenase (short-subunit alcohol dehydrogenase family)